jgi:hypothetical protein
MNQDCVICYTTIEESTAVTCRVCNHTICRECYNRLIRLKCPMCRTYYHNSVVGNIESRLQLALMEIIVLYEQRNVLLECRTFWQFHLNYLRSQVESSIEKGNGELVNEMIGETDLTIAEIEIALGHIDSSIEQLYSTIINSREMSAELLSHRVSR